jgi:cytochrome oxidase Cu insertion factor (SCO1/SenC/PrrC family)
MLVLGVSPLFGFDDAADPSRYFPNQVLRDQNGRAVRFYSDLLQGKTVVIHSFFATCHDACPVIFGKLKAIQESFGDHLGKDLLFLSISVDPANDVPAKLREVADSVGAKPGWLFLSGVKPNVDWVLYKLGQYTPVREDHSTVLLVGNQTAGVWTRLDASMPTERLRLAVDQVLHSKTQSAQ